jgi:hypothetical protein
MKLFGFNIGGSKPEPIIQQTGREFSHFAFSTPFINVGENNLSMPYINRYYQENNIVRFGTDNLYPQILNQLYFTSPIHGTCIEFITNSVIGGSYSWADEKVPVAQKIEEMAFEKSNKFKKLSRLLTRDYVIHRRVAVIVTKRGNKAVKLRRLDPSSIRNNINLENFVYSSDWSRGMVNMREFRRYQEGCGHVESLYVYQDNSPGQDVYPIPQYNSILNWAYLDGETAYFHKSNIQNSVFPSIVIRRPKEFDSIDEINTFKEGIASKTGAGNAGRVLVLTGNGMDDVPTFQSVDTNANDKVFEGTMKELKESIAIAHGLNPAVMGVKTGGQLGATTEIKDSYTIYEKNVVMVLRETMEEILNDLIDIAGIPNSVIINNFQIVEGIIVDATETKTFTYEPKK